VTTLWRISKEEHNFGVRGTRPSKRGWIERIELRRWLKKVRQDASEFNFHD
jgi:hypothetical protein